MKKTISIHLTGFVFNIEEDAYEILNEYLNKIRVNLTNDAGCAEIMEDIEMRIAELFQEKIGVAKEVITRSDLDQVIIILGDPEDFATEVNEPAQPDSQREEPSVKRLFRDRDASKIGGVCSGLGHYFGVEALIIRLVFLFLFLVFGTGVLLYIVLLILIPEAKTTSEKLEMRGEPVNLDNIKKHVKEFGESLSAATRNSSVKNSVRSAVETSVERTKSFLEIFAKIVGVGFILGGFVLLILFLTIAFFDTGIIPFIDENRIEDSYTAFQITYPGTYSILLIFTCFSIVCIIPLISLIITGVRIITKNRAKAKQITWTLSISWVLAGSLLFIYSIGLVSDLKKSTTLSNEIPLTELDPNHFTIDVWSDDQFSNHIKPYVSNHYSIENRLNSGTQAYEMIKVDEETIYFGLTELSIVTKKDTGDFQLLVYKHARGSNSQDAINRAENVKYSLKFENNTLYFPPYFSYPRKDKLRAQRLSFKLIVPMGKSITFGDQISRLRLDKKNYDPLMQFVPLDTMIYATNVHGDTVGIQEIRID